MLSEPYSFLYKTITHIEEHDGFSEHSWSTDVRVKAWNDKCREVGGGCRVEIKGKVMPWTSLYSLFRLRIPWFLFPSLVLSALTFTLFSRLALVEILCLKLEELVGVNGDGTVPRQLRASCHWSAVSWLVMAGELRVVIPTDFYMGFEMISVLVSLSDCFHRIYL